MNSQAAKRYACDRCRAQKLKCSRSESSDHTRSPCERCLRLGALCFTGGGRPLGRPPLNAAAPSQGQAAPGTFRNTGPVYGQRGATGYAARTQRSLSSPVRTPPSRLAHALAAAASAADPLGNMAAVAAPALWLETPSVSVAPTSCGDFVMPTASSQGAGFSGFDMTDFELDELDELDDSDYHHLGDMMPSRGDSEDNVSAAASPKTNDDQAAFVIGLLGSILLQLAELKRQPWDTWDPRMTRAAFFHGPASDLTGSRDMGLWNGALAVTMRFAMVLQRLGATYHHHPPPPAPASGAAESPLPPPPSSERLSTTLMLLSAYLQLGELFCVILGRISSCLLDDEAEMRQSRQQQPTHVSRQSFSSWLSDLTAVPHTNIQIVMMLQMAECQLRTVERLMGLPDEGRIWSGSNGEPDGGGVLDLEESSNIVRAYLAQARPTFQALKQAHEQIRGMLPEGAQRYW